MLHARSDSSINNILPLRLLDGFLGCRPVVRQPEDAIGALDGGLDGGGVVEVGLREGDAAGCEGLRFAGRGVACDAAEGELGGEGRGGEDSGDDAAALVAGGAEDGENFLVGHFGGGGGGGGGGEGAGAGECWEFAEDARRCQGKSVVELMGVF